MTEDDHEHTPTMWQLVQNMEERMETKAAERHRVVVDLAKRVTKGEIARARLETRIQQWGIGSGLLAGASMVFQAFGIDIDILKPK